MLTLKISILVFILSIITPLKAQWNLAYVDPGLGGSSNLHFVDNNHGWFTGSFSEWSGARIVVTTDGGFTFSPQSTPSGTYNLYDIFMEDTLNGWAVGDDIILHTTNAGANWVQVTNPAPAPSGLSNITKVGNSKWIFGGCGNDGHGVILKTSNNGQSWLISEYSSMPWFYGYVFDTMNFIVYGGDAVGGNGLFSRTTDGGSTWISSGLNPFYQVEEVDFANTTIGYATITDWTDIWNTKSYLYASTNGGLSWNLRYSWLGPVTGMPGLSVIGPSTLFVTGRMTFNPDNNGILKSVDGGFSWSIGLQNAIKPPRKIVTPDSQHGWTTSDFAGGPIYRYDYEPPAYDSIKIPLSTNWNMVSLPLNVSNDSAKVIFPLLQGNAFGFSSSYYPAYTLQNGYGYWVKYPSVDTIQVAGSPFIMFKVDIYQAGWAMIGSVSTAVSINSISTNPDNAMIGAVFTFQNGSYTTVDSLKTGNGYWVKVTQPCQLYVSSFYQGTLAPVSAEELQELLATIPSPPDVVTSIEQNLLLLNFTLKQNYPNPFNPTTKIKYSIPSVTLRQAQSDIRVALKVYDILGREVATLVNEEKPAGEYEVEFNAANLPSGIYFYQLNAGSYSETKKMVLLK